MDGQEIEKEVEQLEDNKGNEQAEATEQPSAVVVEVSSTDDTKPSLSGFRARLAEKYKDSGEDFGDDEVYEKYLNKSYDDAENELKGYHDTDSALADLFDTYPEFKDLISDIAIKHISPRVAISRNFSMEDLIPNADDEDYKDWQEVENKRKADNAKQKEFEEMLFKNIGESNGIIDKFCTDKSYDEEKKKAIIAKADAISEELFNGKVSNELLDMISKALEFDKAIEAAKAMGEIKGRNANIEARMETSERKKEGDGLPTPQSSGYKPKMINGKKAVIDFSKFENR